MDKQIQQKTKPDEYQKKKKRNKKWKSKSASQNLLSVRTCVEQLYAINTKNYWK